jgi:hypothetical protein
VLSEDGSLESADLAKGDGLESTGPFESKAETANSAEEIEDTERQSEPSRGVAERRPALAAASTLTGRVFMLARSLQ